MQPTGIDQVLRDGTNHRTDRYGGPLANRVRFLLEVTEALTEVWGADRVGVRISPIGAFNDMSDSDPEATFNCVAERLDRFGLAYLHVVEGDEGNESTDETQGQPTTGFDFKRLRRSFSGLYMANFGYTFARAETALGAGRADLVSFGKLFLANPDLPKRFARGAPLNAADHSTFYGGGEQGYTDYPALTNLRVSASAARFT